MNCLSAKFYSFVYVSLDGVYTEAIEVLAMTILGLFLGILLCCHAERSRGTYSIRVFLSHLFYITPLSHHPS